MTIVLGAGTAAALAGAAFRSAIPGPRTRLLWLAAAFAAVWLALLLYGFRDPALAPSMSGKREHCAVETLIVGVPALLAGIWALRRWWPLRGAISGALVGLAAGVLPAISMQIACMYEPMHGITHHVLPGLALSLPGAVLGAVLLRRPRPPPAG